MSFCVKCGKELVPEATFCGSCGASQAASTPPTKPEEPKRTRPSGSKRAGIIAGSIGALLGLVLIVATVTNHPDPVHDWCVALGSAEGTIVHGGGNEMAVVRDALDLDLPRLRSAAAALNADAELVAASDKVTDIVAAIEALRNDAASGDQSAWDVGLKRLDDLQGSAVVGVDVPDCHGHN